VGDRSWNVGSPVKYGRYGNPIANTHSLFDFTYFFHQCCSHKFTRAVSHNGSINLQQQHIHSFIVFIFQVNLGQLSWSSGFCSSSAWSKHWKKYLVHLYLLATKQSRLAEFTPMHLTYNQTQLLLWLLASCPYMLLLFRENMPKYRDSVDQKFSTFVTLWTPQKFQARVADPTAQGAPFVLLVGPEHVLLRLHIQTTWILLNAKLCAQHLKVIAHTEIIKTWVKDWLHK